MVLLLRIRVSCRLVPNNQGASYSDQHNQPIMVALVGSRLGLCFSWHELTAKVDKRASLPPGARPQRLLSLGPVVLVVTHVAVDGAAASQPNGHGLSSFIRLLTSSLSSSIHGNYLMGHRGLEKSMLKIPMDSSMGHTVSCRGQICSHCA